MSDPDFDPCQEPLDLPDFKEDPGIWEDQDDQDWAETLAAL
jgi:hypothetical protein